GRTKGAKRVVAVDVTGLPVGALVVPASTHENRTSEVMLEHLNLHGVTDRLELVLVDRGVTAAAAREFGRRHGVEVRRVGWDDKQPVFRPSRHAWRVEVAHGRLGRARRLAKSFENTTASATGWLQIACVATILRHMPAARGRRRPVSLRRERRPLLARSPRHERAIGSNDLRARGGSALLQPGVVVHADAREDRDILAP
ncbi:MAG: transposase family protein, partial [Marmoricola sp.]|nr:transposase family protein [Marmoricola sp.]